jgi:hypothetical protein
LSYGSLRNSKIIQLPTELFSEICTHLSPASLYSLSLVCHHFRNILWSTSSLTQEIWKTSRKKFHPTINDKSNSNNCVEQEFIWKMLLSKKCEFCKLNYLNNNFKEIITVGYYWPFQVDICVKCVKDNRSVDESDRKFALKLIDSVPF